MENNIILYSNNENKVILNVTYLNHTFWLPQKAMAALFGVEIPAISKHLKNIFESGELQEEAVISKMETTANDGKNYITSYYNLDAIISVGYRVNSVQATQFRIWATQTLKEFVVKGFVLNDEMLKNGNLFGKDYFQELLERIRSIRSSERRIYQQITDIFAECSIDYNPQDDTTKYFYAMVQNKFHFAITGETAAEIIYHKADSEQANMGLTTWENSPLGRILKSDATIAKNYLTENEIKRLERTVTGYFDYLENLIENRISFTMKDLAESVNKFLTFNEYKILEGLGQVSKRQADEKASAEYEKFNKTQPILSDFDKVIRKQLGNNKK